jgi:hypothetical protein
MSELAKPKRGRKQIDLERLRCLRCQAAARWSLASGGEYYGVGAGVGISGFRADLGLVVAAVLPKQMQLEDLTPTRRAEDLSDDELATIATGNA